MFVGQSAVDKATQKAIPGMLQMIILNLTHYPLLSRHPRERKMYDTPCQKHCWPHMVSDIYQTLKDCQTCPEEGIIYLPQRKFKMIPSRGSLEIVAIDIVRPCPNSAMYIQFRVVIMDHYSILKGSMLAGR